jgi:hypothetical protein
VAIGAMRRAAVVPATLQDGVDSDRADSVETEEDAACAKPSRASGYQRAELMRRTFGVDVLASPRAVGSCASWR